MTQKRNPRPSSEKLTKYIHTYMMRVGWPPSRREIAEHFEVSPSTAQRAIEIAADDGLLRHNPGGARQISLTENAARVTQQKQITNPNHQMKG